MSGPKCGDYTLIERERRRIQEENRRKIELNLKYEKINKFINKLKVKVDNLQNYIDNNENAIEDKYTLNSIKELITRLKEKKYMHNKMPANLNELLIEEKKAEKEIEELENLEKEINRDSSILTRKIEKEEEIKLEIQDISERTIDINFSIKPNDERKEKYEKYLIYAKECNLKKTKELKEFNNLEDLQKEIDKLEEKYNKKAEEEYIEQSVNEVMKELGYDIISSDILSDYEESENIEHKAIYAFEDDTGIEVFSSDSGTLMMEVVNISEYTKEISEDDRNLAFEKMQKFCEKYPVIIEKLKEKGIELKNIEYMPPDKSFTKKVIVSNKDKFKNKKESNMINKRRKKQNGLYKSM